MGILYPIVEPARRFLKVSTTNLFQCSSIRAHPIRYDHIGTTVLAHCFLQEFQRRLLVPALCHVVFQRFACVVHCSPEIEPFAVDLDENLVEVPTPTARPHPLDTVFFNLRREHRTKPMPPISNSFMTDIDASFMQQVFDIS